MNKIFKHVRKDVKMILGRMINTTQSKLKWIGTQAKLMEIVYMLWLTGLIVNEEGNSQRDYRADVHRAECECSKDSD